MAKKKTVAVGKIVARPKAPAKNPLVPAKKTPAATRPAYGTYDPSLDQQERAGERGLGYLLSDTQKAGERDTVDYGLGKADIEQSAGRSLADLLKARAQQGEDYQKNLADLSKSYTRLANTQAQRAAAAGVQGGAAVQAAQKRAANETADRQPLDTNYQRNMAASAQAESRLAEDRTSSLGRLLSSYQRGNEDRTSDLTKATAENTFYGQDINELRIDQAKQAGLLPVTAADVDPVTGRPRAKTKKVKVGKAGPVRLVGSVSPLGKRANRYF